MKTKIKKNWYGRIKSAQELHHDSKRWLSDIDFINDEIRFLNHLLSSNYINFLEYGLKNDIKDLQTKITNEKVIGHNLLELIQNHDKILSELIDNDSVTSNTNFTDKHKKLELEIESYIQNNKNLKKSIFNIIETILKRKDQKTII